MSRLAGLWQHITERPRLAALALGLLSASGFQPLGLWPLALAAMAMFAALIAETPDARRAALLGWLFGVAHFTFSNNWIAEAFTHQAQMPAVLGWAAHVQARGALPIYSTSWSNTASQAVARSLGLVQFAADFHVA